MIVKPGDVWVTEFTTSAFGTGAATDATGTPAGVLVINGTDDAATVTVTKITTGRYKASVTVPAGCVAGDTLAMAITATVATVAGAGIVAHATVDTKRVGALQDLAAGAAMTLTSGERTSIGAAVWAALTSALTTVGSIGEWVLAKLDVLVSTRLAGSAYSAPPAASAVADAVWDEAIGGHAGAGSTGAALSAAGGAADPLLNAVPGTYAAGTAGNALGLIDDIKLQTDLIYATGVNVATTTPSGTLAIKRGDTLVAHFAYTASLVGRTKMVFAIKARPETEADSASYVYVAETSGLSVLNGAAYTTTAHGTLGVTAGVSVDLTINEDATALLNYAGGTLKGAAQWWDASGNVTEILPVDVTISPDVVRTTT